MIRVKKCVVQPELANFLWFGFRTRVSDQLCGHRKEVPTFARLIKFLSWN